MPVYNWSQTAATNSTADATINWAEGQAPSSVNDSARALMAAVAKWRDDKNGTLATGGTSTAYTVTTNSVYDSLAHMNGARLTLKMHATSGATPTLNVDGLGAKSIVWAFSVGFVTTGDLVVNGIYDFVYDSANAVWSVIAPYPSTLIPSGTLMLFQQTSAPTGWTKQTTHNDKALRVVSGTASSGGSTAFSTVMAQRTIVTANLPPYTPAGTVSAPTITDSATGNSSFNVNTGGSGGNGFPSVEASFNGASAAGTHTFTASAPTFTGTAQGGTSTPMDFAVQYVDLIIAAKN